MPTAVVHGDSRAHCHLHFQQCPAGIPGRETELLRHDFQAVTTRKSMLRPANDERNAFTIAFELGMSIV
jgi:hypothetical protein